MGRVTSCVGDEGSRHYQHKSDVTCADNAADVMENLMTGR